MILNKEILVKITYNKTIAYYKNKGYNIEKIGISALINIEDLPLTSKVKIDTECDYCHNKKNILYRDYIKNIKKYNLYSCSEKCAHKLNKNKNTLKERYGDEKYYNIEKCKKTNLEKYGYECNFSDKDERGKHNLIKEKKYNDKNFNNKEKTKITVLNKSKDEKDKITKRTSKTKKDRPQSLRDLQIHRLEETNLKRFGFKSAMQNEAIFNYSLKQQYKKNKHKNTGLIYQSLNEKDFLDFCINNKIVVEKGKRIKYYYNNTEKYYYSDFFIPKYNLIIEIKSSYTLFLNLKINLMKREYTHRLGYNYLFIIDYDYTEFISILNTRRAVRNRERQT